MEKKMQAKNFVSCYLAKLIFNFKNQRLMTLNSGNTAQVNPP